VQLKHAGGMENEKIFGKMKEDEEGMDEI